MKQATRYWRTDLATGEMTCLVDELPAAQNAAPTSAAGHGARAAVGSRRQRHDPTETVVIAAEIVRCALTCSPCTRHYLRARVHERFPTISAATADRRTRLAIAALRADGEPIVLRKYGGYRLMRSGADLEAWRARERCRALRILWTISRVTGESVDAIVGQARVDA